MLRLVASTLKLAAARNTRAPAFAAACLPPRSLRWRPGLPGTPALAAPKRKERELFTRAAVDSDAEVDGNLDDKLRRPGFSGG